MPIHRLDGTDPEVLCAHSLHFCASDVREAATINVFEASRALIQ